MLCAKPSDPTTLWQGPWYPMLILVRMQCTLSSLFSLLSSLLPSSLFSVTLSPKWCTGIHPGNFVLSKLFLHIITVILFWPWRFWCDVFTDKELDGDSGEISAVVGTGPAVTAVFVPDKSTIYSGDGTQILTFSSTVFPPEYLNMLIHSLTLAIKELEF